MSAVARPAFALSWPVRRERVALGCVLLVALVLRAVALAGTPLNPFYDAAVRTMGGSWHAFLTGALDPSGQVAVDKPPVDLWLQVASVKLLGFGTAGLLLPGVLCGVACVALLYDLVTTLAGARAGLVAAAALAVLPLDVITARSDTMDVAMSALMLGALAVTARGRVVLGGALVGLAFEVKLFEALLALVPLAVLWLYGARGLSLRRRLLGLGGALAACAVVGVAWLVVLTVAVPAAQRPWAFGSPDGSAWKATFLYDGWDRLTGGGHPPMPGVAHGRIPAPPGPLRLLSARDALGGRLGLELAAAWLALAAVVATRAWRRLTPSGRAGLAALGAWLALGTLLFSAQAGFRPRYAEAFTPAIAGVLGIAVVLLARGRARTLVALGLTTVLAASATTAIGAVRDHAEDAGTLGALPAARLGDLSAYLRAHQGAARYEAADLATTKAAALIAADGHAQLILTADRGRPLVSPAGLAAAVASGAVRYAISGPCTAATPDGCTPAAHWIRAHGTDVSRAAGQPHAGLVYRLRRHPRPPGRVARTSRTAPGAGPGRTRHGR